MKKIKVTFPNGFTATATLKEKEEPEVTARVWEQIEKPLKLAGYHTVSTGGFFTGMPRPPKHMVESGSQLNPIGNVITLISDIEMGGISWGGWAYWFTYAPCTEIVSVGGPVIAQVDPEYMEGYTKACQDVWHHEYYFHKLPVMTIERGEE